MSGCIVGWAHSKFGKHEGRDIESLIVEVTQAALADAGVAAADIDTVYLGTMNGGFVRQEFSASLVFQADPGFRFKPATRVEDACATGSAAIHQGLNAIAAGRARLALVVGVEKMSEVSSAQVGDILLGASYRKEEDAIEGGFAGIFGQIAQSYFQRYGDQSEALARIAAKNHKNGVANPLAQMQKDLGYEFCRTVSDKNPIVAGPLKRTDCSLVSDGAAAVVLADTATALCLKKAVIFRAAEQVNDFLPMSRRDVVAFEGPALAWKRALAAARLGLGDLDLVETHDCFTIAELIEYEAMGLTPKGEGARAILEGWTEKDGKLPVNPSGGLKSKGHPIGATGVSMHVLAAMQVTGKAGGIQVPGASLAGVMNMGGAAVANFVSILEPLRLNMAAFRALVLREEGGKAVPRIEAVDEALLPPGEVTVGVECSTLNYKDGLILQGLGRLVRTYPHVPGIDFAGTVEHSASPEFEPGDPVVLTGWRVGETQWGGYAEKARVPASFLVRRPDKLSARQAMAIGTAGFTAMLAVMTLERHGLAAGSGDVLVTGAAGGVGSVAISLLSRLGYRVAASTGRPELRGYLTELGAAELIDRTALAAKPSRPLDSERWAGAVDAVGGTTLATILTQLKYRASVAACGLAGGSELPTTVIPFLLRGVNLLGINSVMCPREERIEAWQRLARDLPLDRLERMTQTVPLSALPELAPKIIKGEIRGRTVVDVTG